ncbi:FadR family transcriptional regulator [Flavobacteriaceae bacterium]|nr:FadR family transcriptional regulator [Flavobacteriaceae bacterium]
MAKLKTIKRKPITEQSVEILKDFIMDGKLKSGDFLPPEMELCKQLGIGRSTLREAVKILELQGFVKKRHGVGVMVVEESYQAASDMLSLMLKRTNSSLLDIVETRNVIEVKTAELAALNATEDDLAVIEEYLIIMQNSKSSLEEYIIADVHFHIAIAKASKNTVLHFILDTILQPFLEDVVKDTTKTMDRPEITLRLHEYIYTAIKDKDAPKAINAMKKHLVATESMLNE